MSPHDALADGRLADAVAIQEAVVAADPHDPAARRFLVDLLAFAGQFAAAGEQLAAIRFDDPAWQEAEHALRLLLRADRLRTAGRRAPCIIPDPPPKHATRRRRAIQHLRHEKPGEATRYIDGADAVAPEVRGFLDGQEFVGLRDADDRFASVLEAFRDGQYVWIAWEAVRKVALAPAAVLLDQLYRPAVATMRDGTAVAVHLPLVYPASHEADGAFALGMETDHVCPDGGPTRCIGGKLLLIGDGAEVALSECRMIEVR